MFKLKSLFVLGLSFLIMSCGEPEKKNPDISSKPEVPFPTQNQEESLENLYSRLPESQVVTLYFYDPLKSAYDFIKKDYTDDFSKAHVIHFEPYGNTLWWSIQNQSYVGSRGRQTGVDLLSYRFFNGKVYRKKNVDEPPFVDDEMRELNNPINPNDNSHHFQFGPGPSQRWLIRIASNNGETDFLVGIKILEVIGGQSVTFRWYLLGGVRW